MGQFAEVGGAAHPDLRIESPVTASSENSRIPPEPGMSSYEWPELTNWPPGTQRGSKQERSGGLLAGIRQIRVPATDRPFGGDNGKQMISVRPAASAKSGCFRPKKYTTNGVGMRHC